MRDSAIASAIDAVPAGAWGLGVSGGADGVALLRLLLQRSDVQLRVIHLDHEARPGSSDDARFVESLCARFNIPCTISRRSQIEPILSDLPANLSARFRRLRFALFKQVVEKHGLAGVMLAHHADDQAETVLHRLLRGSGPAGLAGMSPNSNVGGLLIRRPLLRVRSTHLREVLVEMNQPWREDPSNLSPQYLRNRLRMLLQEHPKLFDCATEMGDKCAALRDWIHNVAPNLEPEFPVAALARLPVILARESANRWLGASGVPRELIIPATIDRLIVMASDAATGARQQFPGGVTVVRRRGSITVDAPT